MNRLFSYALIVSTIAAPFAGAQSQEVKPLRIAIAGLNHGHVCGFLSSARRRAADVVIVAVWDPDATLLAKYASRTTSPPISSIPISTRCSTR